MVLYVISGFSDLRRGFGPAGTSALRLPQNDDFLHIIAFHRHHEPPEALA
jgi:hypothetical protein